MKIKTQFILTSSVFALILTIIIISTIIINQWVNAVSRQELIAENISREAEELDYLSEDYLIHGERQQLEKWQEKFTVISNHITSLRVRRSDLRTLVANLQLNQKRLKDIFQNLSSSGNKLWGQEEVINRMTFQASWSRVVIQIRGLMLDSSRLSQLLRKETDQLVMTRTIIIYLTLALFGLFILFGYVLIYVRILKSITVLQSGTAVIGSGNLDLILNEKCNDEIGDLTHAFNRMTANLKNVTASKTELQKEIAKRIKAEQRNRAILESMGDGFFACDAEWKFVYVNTPAENILGIKRDEVIGRTYWDVFPFTKGTQIEKEFRLAADGLYRDFDNFFEYWNHWLYTRCLPRDGGGITVYFSDITDSKRHEINSVFFAGITREFATLSSIPEIIQSVIPKLGMYLNVSGCYFSCIEESNEQAYTEYEWHTGNCAVISGEAKISEFISRYSIQSVHAGEVIVIQDSSNYSHINFDDYAKLNLFAFISVPYLKNDEWKYLLTITSATPRSWRDDEIELVSEVTNRLSLRIGRAQADDALKASKEQYQALFNSIDEGFCIIEVIFDRNEKISDFLLIKTNPAFEKQTGFHNVEGKLMRSLSPEKEEFWFEAFSRIATTGKPERFERELRALKKYFDVYAFRVDEPEKHRVAILFKDITTRKQNEDALRKLNETLEQRVEKRTALAESRAKQLQGLAVQLIEAEEKERRRIAGILHEDLQQLLAGARFVLQSAIERHPLTELKEVEHVLEESIQKSRNLSHELSPAVLHQSGLWSALEWLSSQMYEQFGLNVNLDPSPSRSVESTPLRIFLFRAVQELLFNVVKHSGVKKAGVHFSEKDDRLSITVRDSGRGFDPSVLDKATPKTGLGLISLRERASYIGGEMLIESTPGNGSSITITVTTTRIPESVYPSGSGKKGFHSETDINAAVSDGDIRVLLADDHKVLRQGLINLISGQPHIKVTGEAADGMEAIQLALQLKPDVIIMDVSMPGMDGIEATMRIKDVLPEVRVIGLSMFEDEQTVRKMLNAGAEAFVTKTASSTELLKAIYGRHFSAS